MSLQNKTLLIIVITLVCLFIILYGGARGIFLVGFDDIEKNDGRESLRDASAALSTLLEEIELELNGIIVGGDLAGGVELGEVIAGESDRVLRGDAGIIAFIDTTGTVVYGYLLRGFDPIAGELPGGLARHLELGSPLVNYERTEPVVKGIALVDAGPMLIASQKISASETSLGVPGLYVLGRFFDQAKEAAIERILNENVTIHRLDRSNLSVGLTEIQQSIESGSRVFSRPLDEDYLANYEIIYDIYEKAAVLLQVDVPRVGHRIAVRVEQNLLLAFLLSGVAFAIVILRLLRTQIISRVLVLGSRVSVIAKSADASQRVPVTGKDELAELATSINTMLEALEDAQGALQETLGVVRDTQEQLVQSEKMAALGGLVAGVAHEINTPVGVGVTAASHLEERVRHYNKLYDAGGLKRSDFEALLKTASETSSILMVNLSRAAELVQSFKQVAVDQASEEKRVFQLGDYLNEILTSLWPQLKKTRHRVNVNCPEELEIETFPGPLAQIITNLVMNSLNHAFGEVDEGHIAIEVEDAGSDIVLLYRDDGCGLKREHLDKIFDPFFTTKRGQGGSGLGSHIIYNLVTQVLRGKIDVSSKVGEGMVFRIEFPKRVEASHVGE